MLHDVASSYARCNVWSDTVPVVPSSGVAFDILAMRKLFDGWRWFGAGPKQDQRVGQQRRHQPHLIPDGLGCSLWGAAADEAKTIDSLTQCCETRVSGRRTARCDNTPRQGRSKKCSTVQQADSSSPSFLRLSEKNMVKVFQYFQDYFFTRKGDHRCFCLEAVAHTAGIASALQKAIVSAYPIGPTISSSRRSWMQGLRMLFSIEKLPFRCY